MGLGTEGVRLELKGAGLGGWLGLGAQAEAGRGTG